MTTTTASVTSGSLAKVAAEIEAWDATRPRSLQTAIGASGLYGCRAEHTLRLNEVPESDPHLSWAALVGTAIHGVAEAAAPASVLTEQRFTYRGVTATIDRYDAPVLVDLKTKEDAAAIAKVRKTGPRREQIAQVMLGAAALQEAGYVVEQVELLFLPRVGSLEDGWSWRSLTRPLSGLRPSLPTPQHAPASARPSRLRACRTVTGRSAPRTARSSRPVAARPRPPSSSMRWSSQQRRSTSPRMRRRSRRPRRRSQLGSSSSPTRT
jgi:hypothetical protein